MTRYLPVAFALVFTGSTLTFAGCGGGGDAGLDGGSGGGVDATGGSDAGSDRDGGSGDPDAGAEAACAAYQAECDGECVLTNIDPLNCGGCGVTCDEEQACSAGACADSCLGGLEICDGLCVDKKSDSDHCGSCGVECEPGQGCVDGNCTELIPVGPDPDKCEGGGPPIVIDDPVGGDGTCAGDMAEVTFRWALCSCDDIELSNPLWTDAYDSTAGSYQPGGLGGGVGLNGGFLNTGLNDIYGALWSSSIEGVTVSNPTNVFQELHVGGPLTANTEMTVDDDAYVAGDISTSGSIAVAGDLYSPESATIDGDVTYSSLVREPVSVEPPCDCDADSLIPIPEIVSARANDNDNDLIGLDPEVLVDPGLDDGNPRRLELPCGHYYLSGIDTQNPLTIVATGRTALYIDSDVVTSSQLTITAEPTGELDLFIAGVIDITNPLRIGNPNYPALTRVYLGGEGAFEFKFTNVVDIGGFVYGAGGVFDFANPIEVFGGIFAGDFRNTGTTEIHYDKKVLEVGGECEDADVCDSCRDCGNQACVDGECGECESSADCCAPLVCNQGQCVPVISATGDGETAAQCALSLSQ